MSSESEWLAKLKIFAHNSYLVESVRSVFISAREHPTVIVRLNMLGSCVVQHEPDFKVMIKHIRRLVPREYTVDYELSFSI